MQLGILGSFEVRDHEGRLLRLPAGRERSLLALLVIHRGEVVSIDRIVDALWGESPPGTAPKAVQAYVSHLRRVLPSERDRGESGGVLVTAPPGYVLRIDEHDVDAARFAQLAAEGRRALEDGSPAEAASLLDSALALWRGPALADFAYEDFAQAEIHRLEELRLQASEDRIASLLELGRHGEVVTELEALLAQHPLRERPRGQLMLALYRSGRQADALQAYRDGRRLLADELGLEPSTELQRLERAILEQKSELEAPAYVPPPAREPERAEPPRRRTRGWLVASGALLVAGAVVAGLVFALTRSDSPPSVVVVPPAVVAVDPATNRVVAAIHLGSKPVSIAAGAGAVWVGDVGDGTVTRVDPVTHATKTVGIGAPAVDVATGFGSVWVATGSFGTVVNIDPNLNLGAVVDRIDLGAHDDPAVPAVSSIAAGEGSVWVGAFAGLGRIAPRSGRLSQKIDLGGVPALQIAVGGGAVWATLRTNSAKRVEARSGQETAEFHPGTFMYPITVDRAVWIGGVNGELWKVDPVTAATLLTSRVASSPVGLAVGAGAVWVAAAEAGTLVRLDAATGEVEGSVAVGGAPEDVVVHRGLVWVAVQAPAAA